MNKSLSHQTASTPCINPFGATDRLAEVHSPPKLFARKPAAGDVRAVVDKKRKQIQNSYNSQTVLVNSLLVNTLSDSEKSESKDSMSTNFKRQSFKLNPNYIEGSDAGKIIQRRQKDNFFSPKITRDKQQYVCNSQSSLGKAGLRIQSGYTKNNFKTDINISTFIQPKTDALLSKSQKKLEGSSFASSNKSNTSIKNQNSCIHCNLHKNTIEVLTQKNSHLEQQLQQKNHKINEINLKLQYFKQINEQHAKSMKHQKLQYLSLMNEKEEFCKMNQQIKMQLSKLLQKYKYLQIQNSMLMRLKKECQQLNIEKNKYKWQAQHFKKELVALKTSKFQSKEKSFSKKANSINQSIIFLESNTQKRRHSNPILSSSLKKDKISDFDDTVSLNISSDCSCDI